MLTEKEKKQTEEELKNGFTSFYHFALSLIETLDEKNGHLKFAVVNMQIALELFLKYYFIKNNNPEKVFNTKNGKLVFKDFSVVLNAYYVSERDEHYTKKKHLTTIMKARNGIVHKGKFNKWDEELADYIISCAFFIQENLRNKFDETLLYPEYHPHKLSQNHMWRKGAIKFAEKVSAKFKKIPLECPHCYSRALIPKEIFDFDDSGSFDNYQCLSCLVDIDTEISGNIIKCCECNKKSYYVDLLNVQPDNTYLGGCLNCGNKMDLRRCENCEEFYFPDVINTEVIINKKHFCSKFCSELYEEIN